MMQGLYVSFLNNTIFLSRTITVAKELRHFIENEAI